MLINSFRDQDHEQRSGTPQLKAKKAQASPAGLAAGSDWSQRALPPRAAVRAGVVKDPGGDTTWSGAKNDAPALGYQVSLASTTRFNPL